MTSNKRLLLATMAVFLTLSYAGCTKDVPQPNPGGGGGSTGPTGPTGTAIDPNAKNVAMFAVNDDVTNGSNSICSKNSYTNKPCIEVTVCKPDGTNCVTVKDVLVDTGSFGLRLFRDSLTGVADQLPESPVGGLAECMEYGDGSKQWGPVKMATVRIGKETASNIPMQVIDANYGGMNSACSGAERTSADAGFNGILGIGVFVSDCGDYCANDNTNQVYFKCAGSSCNAATVAHDNQVQNPIAHFAADPDNGNRADNNGVAVVIPSVPAGGAPSRTGYLVFGISTRSNNVPSTSFQNYPVDATFGEFKTQFGDNTYNSFIDTGSNALGIPPTRGLPDCSATDGNFAGWLCPSGTQSYSATNTGTGGYPTGTVNFKVGNFISLFGSGNGVFSESAYASSNNITGLFDWGLPFYFGKTVIHKFENSSAVSSSGPAFIY
ncbi:MAG: DUF3443 family protein [Bdellovibrionales bacterium]|nr:DUF3443 family protein [Bdellovibrionales bacterium]